MESVPAADGRLECSCYLRLALEMAVEAERLAAALAEPTVAVEDLVAAAAAWSEEGDGSAGGQKDRERTAVKAFGSDSGHSARKPGETWDAFPRNPTGPAVAAAAAAVVVVVQAGCAVGPEGCASWMQLQQGLQAAVDPGEGHEMKYH